jgi:hypothetical protein
MKEFKVTFFWHSGMWCANAPKLGLTLEHGSLDALLERVCIAAPEMAELNFGHVGDIELVFSVRRTDKLRAKTA